MSVTIKYIPKNADKYARSSYRLSSLKALWQWVLAMKYACSVTYEKDGFPGYRLHLLWRKRTGLNGNSKSVLVEMSSSTHTWTGRSTNKNFSWNVFSWNVPAVSAGRDHGQRRGLACSELSNVIEQTATAGTSPSNRVFFGDRVTYICGGLYIQKPYEE